MANGLTNALAGHLRQPGDRSGAGPEHWILELIQFYDLIVNLSADAAMLPYVFCSVVEAILFVTRKPVFRALRIGPMTLPAIVAFVFSVATVYRAGPEAGMWALILVLLTVPVWVLLMG